MELLTLPCTIFPIMFLAWGTLAEVKEDNIDTIKTRLEEEKESKNLLQNVVEIWRYLADLERRLGCNQFDKQTTNSTVGFTAELSTSQNYPPLKTIIFDRVLENQGGAYNSVTGVFKAPLRGMYILSVTIHSTPPHGFRLELMKNHSFIGRVFAGDSKSNWGDTGSVTVVTYMDTNDEVYVRGMSSNGVNIYGEGLSSFTGVLISRFK